MNNIKKLIIEFKMKKQFKDLVCRTILIITTIISLVACGNKNNDKENKTELVDTAVQQDQGGTDVTAAASYDVLFKGKNGDVISLNSLKGKVVFINFWATWCPPCIEELPSIHELKKTFTGNENIVFLMVDVDNNMDKSVAFMDDKKYNLPVYVPASTIPSDFLGGAIPTTVILDKTGKLVTQIEGARDYTDPEIVKAIQELVAEK